MAKRKLAALEKVEADLANLRHKIRCDPESYSDNFQQQWEQYESLYGILMDSPDSVDDSGIVSARELIDFVVHVADCYPSKTKRFPNDLIVLLQQHHENLDPELREKVVGSLAMLRNKGLLDPSEYVGHRQSQLQGTRKTNHGQAVCKFIPHPDFHLQQASAALHLPKDPIRHSRCERQDQESQAK